jgi:hypothetical protein
MQMRRGPMSILALCLVCLVGFACSGSGSGSDSESCGGIAGIQCADDEYCDYTNNHCGDTDFPGTCKRRPKVCIERFQPTCACDGEVYNNECDAASHGVDVSANGDCD